MSQGINNYGIDLVRQENSSFSTRKVNPLHAIFFRGNKKHIFYFMSFLNIDMTQVVEILPQVGQERTYSTQSISWVLMSW